MTDSGDRQAMSASLRKMLIPLALAQFIFSFAGSNMNVMINDISHDLDTTVQGVQVCITLFLLVMAALMIPCGKLTDKVGRKRCFTLGLAVYGVGAVLSAVAPGLGVLILGNSIFEGEGGGAAADDGRAGLELGLGLVHGAGGPLLITWHEDPRLPLSGRAVAQGASQRRAPGGRVFTQPWSAGPSSSRRDQVI